VTPKVRRTRPAGVAASAEDEDEDDVTDGVCGRTGMMDMRNLLVRTASRFRDDPAPGL
jgi:hypothetical protein